MVASGCQICPVSLGANTDRESLERGRGAITDLAAGVGAPGPQASIGLQRQRMLEASGDPSPGRAAVELNKFMGIREAAGPELTPIIPSTNPQCAVGLQGQAVPAACRDGGPI